MCSKYRNIKIGFMMSSLCDSMETFTRYISVLNTLRCGLEKVSSIITFYANLLIRWKKNSSSVSVWDLLSLVHGLEAVEAFLMLLLLLSFWREIQESKPSQVKSE